MGKKRKLHIYTDGSSLGFTPNYVGGWGLVVVDENKDEILETLTGNNFPSTNNEMELQALLEAIRVAKNYVLEKKYDIIYICSDSAYSLGIATSWARSWSMNGWCNSKNQEVANIDIVKEIWKEVRYESPYIKYKKVKGHSGDIYNDWADKLATDASGFLKDKLIEEGVLDKNGQIKKQ